MGYCFTYRFSEVSSTSRYANGTWNRTSEEIYPLQIRSGWLLFLGLAFILAAREHLSAASKTEALEPLVLASGWQLQDAAKVPQTGTEVSSPAFNTIGWYSATVPGTVLTTLVNNHVYPEPLYGDDNRPEKIPESLSHSSYWYRAEITIPRSYLGKHIWLNFDGINYSAAIWVNGSEVGTMRGSFSRGVYDISYNVKPGKKAVLAVLVTPQPNPGVPHEHTLRNGVGKNGGITAIAGPTFLYTTRRGWLPATLHRDTRTWQEVFHASTAPALAKD